MHLLRHPLYLSILCILGGSSLAPAAIQALPEPLGQSGHYSAMTLGIDPQTQGISGHYESHTGWDEMLQAPRFTCSFYFTGQRQAEGYRIQSWSPDAPNATDRINGNLSFTTQAGSPSILVQLEEDHGGCWNVQHFTGSGATLRLDQAGDWQTVRIVAQPRAYFHQKPHAASRQQSYVIPGDALKIYETRDGWVDAEFGREPVTRGWIKASDLAPAQ